MERRSVIDDLLAILNRLKDSQDDSGTKELLVFLKQNKEQLDKFFDNTILSSIWSAVVHKLEYSSTKGEIFELLEQTFYEYYNIFILQKLSFIHIFMNQSRESRDIKKLQDVLVYNESLKNFEFKDDFLKIIKALILQLQLSFITKPSEHVIKHFFDIYKIFNGILGYFPISNEQEKIIGIMNLLKNSLPDNIVVNFPQIYEKLMFISEAFKNDSKVLNRDKCSKIICELIPEMRILILLTDGLNICDMLRLISKDKEISSQKVIGFYETFNVLLKRMLVLQEMALLNQIPQELLENLRLLAKRIYNRPSNIIDEKTGTYCNYNMYKFQARRLLYKIQCKRESDTIFESQGGSSQPPITPRKVKSSRIITKCFYKKNKSNEKAMIEGCYLYLEVVEKEGNKVISQGMIRVKMENQESLQDLKRKLDSRQISLSKALVQGYVLFENMTFENPKMESHYLNKVDRKICEEEYITQRRHSCSAIVIEESADYSALERGQMKSSKLKIVSFQLPVGEKSDLEQLRSKIQRSRSFSMKQKEDSIESTLTTPRTYR
ncbi:MAG: hypothetical protein PHY80_02130 [Rickettsiales bacterium]|nr:hypothetical protein [Rickettsiales bacterium]